MLGGGAISVLFGSQVS